MDTIKIMTTAAAAIVATFALAQPADAAEVPTLDSLHAAGCVPVTFPEPGANTIRYGGDGQAACKGRLATVTYDATPDDTTDAVTFGDVFDLGSGAYTIDAALYCGQVDVWAGDVTGEINAPGWNPAHRLIVPRFPGPCAPPTPVTAVRVTPAPVPEATPELPPAAVPETPAETPPAPPTTVAAPTPPTLPGVPVVTVGLPVTGRTTRVVVALGLTLLGLGLMAVGASAWRARGDRRKVARNSLTAFP